MEAQPQLKARQIEEVIVICVNDPFVVHAWAQESRTHGSMLTFLADPQSNFARATGLVLDDPKVMEKLGNPRGKRFAALVDNSVVVALHVCGTPEDPAGDDFPDAAQPDAMLAAADALGWTPSEVTSSVEEAKPPVPVPLDEELYVD